MKRIMKIFIFGVCIGIAALIIQKSFHINEDVFMRGYCIAAIVIVIGAVLFNMLYNRYYFKKVRALSEQFLEEKPQDTGIAEICQGTIFAEYPAPKLDSRIYGAKTI